MDRLRHEVLRTLAYYDIWQFPLTLTELHTFLPVNSITLSEFGALLSRHTSVSGIAQHRGYYFLSTRPATIVEQRLRKEVHARFMWRMARLATHIIKRVPFVRGVFVSGELSKNVTGKGSDIDYFVLTAPGRLWIARTILILFKKVFLLNRKTYFCLNYFATTDHLTHDQHTLFTATEIGHLKPAFNTDLYLQYLSSNAWVNAFFPNYSVERLGYTRPNDRRSGIQLVFERVINLFPADRIDTWLMKTMQRVWGRRYPSIEQGSRDRIFRCTKTESRAYVGDFEGKILRLYHEKLKSLGIPQ